MVLTLRRRRLDARALSQNLARRAAVSLRFETGDIRARMPEADRSVDICLCLYGVLNHLPAEDLPAVFGEVARIAKGKLLATVRAIGSTPTIYVDRVKAAKTYYQDNVHGRLEVEFLDGSRTSVPSRLFSASEIRALVTPTLEIEELVSYVRGQEGRRGLEPARRKGRRLERLLLRRAGSGARDDG